MAALLSRGLDAAREARRIGWAAVVYGAFGLFLTCFVVVLVVHPQGWFWTFFVNWVIDGFEVLVAVMCLIRAVSGGTVRPVALTLGLGLLAWSFGDVVFSVQTLGGGNPPTPSWDDALYLAFYPLTYVGVILLLRMEVREVPLTTWLDGVIAGLGAASLTAAFVFETIVRSIGGSPAEVATNVAYPVGDLVARCPRRRRPHRPPHVAQPSAPGPRPGLCVAGGGRHRVPVPVFGRDLPGRDSPRCHLAGRHDAHLRRRSGCVAAPAAVAAAPQTFQFVIPTVAAACGLAVLLRGRPRPRRPGRGHVGPPHVRGRDGALTAVFLGPSTSESVPGTRSHDGRADGPGEPPVSDEHARQALRPRRSAGHLALLLIDLDHFKEINDSFGHQVGDRILAMLGSRLGDALAPSDILVRLGGDEFGVVLTGESARRPTFVAERLTTELEYPFALEVANLHVSASIGIAIVPDHAGTASELLRCADVAMYRAKVVTPAIRRVRRWRLTPASVGSNASKVPRCDGRQLLELYFQPQFDASDRFGAGSGGAPAMAPVRRGRPPAGGIHSLGRGGGADETDCRMGPGERIGAMRPVACCRESGVKISVNLSTTNLLDIDLPDRIRFLLARHRLGAEFLVLELTETTLMNDWRRSRDIVQRLHNLGLTVSVDDFGTGYSSLAYLSELAIGEIKIDRAMIERLSSNEQSEGRGHRPCLHRTRSFIGCPGDCRGGGGRQDVRAAGILRLRPCPGLFPRPTETGGRARLPLGPNSPPQCPGAEWRAGAPSGEPVATPRALTGCRMFPPRRHRDRESAGLSRIGRGSSAYTSPPLPRTSLRRRAAPNQ